MWEDRFSDRICSEIPEIYSHTSVIATHIITITFYALENSKKPNMKKKSENPPLKTKIPILFTYLPKNFFNVLWSHFDFKNSFHWFLNLFCFRELEFMPFRSLVSSFIKTENNSLFVEPILFARICKKLVEFFEFIIILI